MYVCVCKRANRLTIFLLVIQDIIEELEYERRMLSNTIAEKLKDHQDLLQVKMGLALEVAAYR